MRHCFQNLLLVVVACSSMSPTSPNAAEPFDNTFNARLDGSEQRYVVVVPDGVNEKTPASVLIALHGHGSDRWQFVKDDRDECRAARDAAARWRMIYVSPDYRAKTSWMGPAAEADLLQIIEVLRKQFNVRKVVISGGSMGGTGALTFAALHPDAIDGVVSMNGTANLVEYAQFQDAIAASFGGSKQGKPDEYRRRSAELNADKLTMPIAVTTGGRDTIVPPDSVLRLVDTLRKQDRKSHSIHRPEGGHETSYADATAAFEFVLNHVLASNADVTTTPLLDFDEKPITIVCLGDSVTGVYYHSGGRRAFPEMLEIAIRQAIPTSHVKVINAGISGHTTVEGLARFDRDVLFHKPNLVTISFGLNDMTRLSLDQFRSNLEALVDRCRQSNAAVVLCSPNSVISTASRPIEKLKELCDTIHAVAKTVGVPVCDQFAAGELLRSQDAWAFRCTLSDEIHPNMDGHKRMAENLCRTITGRKTSLSGTGPLLPALVKTRRQIERRHPVRILAMPPFDSLIGPALKQQFSDAVFDVTLWPTEAKSLEDLEQFAKQTVRAMNPDLVIIAVPSAPPAETDEQFFRAYSWIMNWSLSFGHQEWDCLVVHPCVAYPDKPATRAGLIRQLVKAQDLILIDRSTDENLEPGELLTKFLKKAW